MFTKTQLPVAGSRPKNGSNALSFIGAEVIITGDLATDSQLHVDGRIDGNVRCQGLIQGEQGTITGNIYADEARLAGTVEGIVSVGLLTVEASASILGDVAYDTISIEAGARIEGRLGRRAPGASADTEEPQLIATPVSFSPARG
jgi:cytoskeletal protein CcmA (bactofilin family)